MSTEDDGVGVAELRYCRALGVDSFVLLARQAQPQQWIMAEKQGVSARFVLDAAKRMRVSSARLCRILRIPASTVARRAVEDRPLMGRSGWAALGMAKLLGNAKVLIENVTSPQAEEVDYAVWLARWIDAPQPAIGGKSPGQIIDTPTGIAVAERLLGAIESGAYQ